MKSHDPDPWTTCLAGSPSAGTEITVRRYQEMHAAKDCASIAAMVELRFRERFLDPILDSPTRHGFAMMAICCLMVETLESFRNGWTKTTDKGGGEVFCSFFQAHEQFAELRPVAHEFYRAVRCGILHQAETTNSWRVHREPGFFEDKGGVRWLSAFEFGNHLDTVLASYKKTLVESDWDSPTWVNARKKLQSVCRNCGLPDAEVAKLV